MRPTGTERPARRVFAAIATATLIHALLFAILAAPSGSPGSGAGPRGGTGVSGSGPGSSRGAAAAGAERGGENRAGTVGETAAIPILVGRMEEDALETPSPESERYSVDGHDPEGDIELGRADGIDSNDGAAFGGSGFAGSGLGDGNGNGDGTGTGGDGGAGIGGGIATRRAFLGWLDDSIKRRLSYPERARARNLEGTVVIALSVPADGSACEATVAESSGVATLDRAAIALVHSLFPAPVAPGTPISARFSVRYALSGK